MDFEYRLLLCISTTEGSQSSHWTRHHTLTSVHVMHHLIQQKINRSWANICKLKLNNVQERCHDLRAFKGIEFVIQDRILKIKNKTKQKNLKMTLIFTFHFSAVSYQTTVPILSVGEVSLASHRSRDCSLFSKVELWLAMDYMLLCIGQLDFSVNYCEQLKPKSGEKFVYYFHSHKLFLCYRTIEIAMVWMFESP